MAEQPRGVHLVGSVPLSDAEEVLRATGGILDGRLRRVPDGETGERSGWVSWQGAVFSRNPAFDTIPQQRPRYVQPFRVRLRPGADLAALDFGNLGYADAAVASYEAFRRVRAEGVLPAGCRFQVCLPTPLAPAQIFVEAPVQPAIETAYETAILAELARVVAAIPHDDLAIQWDTAVEFIFLEGVRPAWFDDLEAGIVERLLRLGNAVPTSIELGYHLCYGDPNLRRFKEPEDTTKLTSVAAALVSGLDRPLHWVHLPVPRDRDDDDYLLPLRELRLPDRTELYLGLVHLTDGAEGTRRRIATATRVLDRPFGAATECGFGRRPPDTITDLLNLHAEVAAPLPASRGFDAPPL